MRPSSIFMAYWQLLIHQETPLVTAKPESLSRELTSKDAIGVGVEGLLMWLWGIIS